MKPFLSDQLRNWFGFSRRERRASFILLLLIAAVITARYAVPERRHESEIITLGSGFHQADSLRDIKYSRNSSKPSKQKASARQRKILELNTCDSSSLEALPGIGPVLARRIIRYRNLLGGFAFPGQLREVYGLPDSTYKIISGRVRADSSRVSKIDLNSADFKRLIRMPYFDKYDATAILKYRELHGRIESLDELVKNKIISQEKAKKLRAYMQFGEQPPPLKGVRGM
jgi:DNA uptake protein ComE-like DNA-binding protein